MIQSHRNKTKILIKLRYNSSNKKQNQIEENLRI